MEPQEKMTPQQFVIDRLQEIQKKAEAGNFAEALENLKEVKSADAKNIYIIAIEKQLIKVSDQAVTEKEQGGYNEFSSGYVRTRGERCTAARRSGKTAGSQRYKRKRSGSGKIEKPIFPAD